MSQNGAADDKVTLTINGTTISTDKGRMLIDVAEEMGIFVPRFCYHPGMKSVAVCRMCLVAVEGQRKLLPACATPVADEMVVNTVDAEAVDAQEGMLEFLLINHPLDCPICDRGGECPLQDQTYRHGPGSSRYVEPKRTYEKALEISDLVVLDRERCVLCWRCVRFCDEISGDQFIQLVDRGAGTQILTFNDEPFDSYFSGNTIQICPVGALTSKPYRFVSRPWDLQTAPSVCNYCSVGCPLTNETRDEKVVRCQALPNEQVNDFWICDKGRFGYHYLSSGDRLTNPLVRGADDGFEVTSWGEATKRIAEAVEGKRVGVIAGGHLMTEDSFAIGRLAREVISTEDVDSRIQDAGAPYEVFAEHGGVAGSTATLLDLVNARSIVYVGPDPKETLPVLYLRLRNATVERGAKLITVSPRRTSLDSLAEHSIRCAPGDEGKALAAFDELDGPTVVVWGPSSPGRDESEVASDIARFAASIDAGVLICVPHSGSQGALDMGLHPQLDPGAVPADSSGKDTRAILEAAAAGELDALLVFGADPIADFPDAELARKALSSDVFVAVTELFPTETVSYADVVLPVAAYAEREATLTNLERRLQKLEPVVSPPGTARPVWDICASIATSAGKDWSWSSFEDVWADLKKQVPSHADVDLEALRQQRILPLREQDQTGYVGESYESAIAMAGPGGQYPKGYRQGAPFQTGQNWPLSWELRAFEAKQRPGFIPSVPPPADSEGPASQRVEPGDSEAAASSGSFVLLAGRMIYDQGAMVSKSVALRKLQKKPFVEMNDEDVKELGLADGDEVVLEGAGNRASLKIVVSDIARGCVFVPYDQDGLRANTLMSGINPTVTVTAP
ncbi:MAG TPA: NADH-quinone oxidoreductase subunit NuoG [Actinomycetota bacterium]|nr:NADH-quinone oxidoreductase subunit NuoG [Actinomycetota bacterium]